MRYISILFLVGCVGHIKLPSTPLGPDMRATITVLCYGAMPFSENPITGESTEDQTWRNTRQASAAVVDSRHLIAAAHTTTCPIMPTIRVVLSDGTHLRAYVVKEDADADVALLEIASAEVIDVPPTKISHRAVPNARCLALHHSLDCGLGDLLVDVETHDGDSGAGAYDLDGNLVGVVSGRVVHHKLTLIAPLPDGWLR